VLLRDVADELLDEDGLADARASEQADLAALHVRGEEVDDLDPGLEDLDLRLELLELRRVAVDRPPLVVSELVLLVDHRAEHVEEPAEGRLAHRDGDRGTRVDHVGAAAQSVRRVHRDRADPVVSEVLLHLRDQRDGLAVVGRRNLDLEGVVDLGQLAGKDGVEDDSSDLDDLPDVSVLVRHSRSWLGDRSESIRAEIAAGRFPGGA
jgi:hypothetical protein